MKTKETKAQKIERIAHAVAVSWLSTSERLLARSEAGWRPSKLSDISEGAMMSITSEFSNLLPWAKIRSAAVSIAKQKLAIHQDEYKLTISHFTKN